MNFSTPLTAKLIPLFFLFASACAFAAPFSLVDQSTGATYQCGSGGSPTGPGTAINPQCLQTLHNFCMSNTNIGRDACYQITSTETGCRLGGYNNCVSTTMNYCISNTNLGRDNCFKQSLSSCRGGSFAQPLLDAVAAQAEKRAEQKVRAELNLAQ